MSFFSRRKSFDEKIRILINGIKLNLHNPQKLHNIINNKLYKDVEIIRRINETNIISKLFSYKLFDVVECLINTYNIQIKGNFKSRGYSDIDLLKFFHRLNIYDYNNLEASELINRDIEIMKYCYDNFQIVNDLTVNRIGAIFKSYEKFIYMKSKYKLELPRYNSNVKISNMDEKVLDYFINENVYSLINYNEKYTPDQIMYIACLLYKNKNIVHPCIISSIITHRNNKEDIIHYLLKSGVKAEYFTHTLGLDLKNIKYSTEKVCDMKNTITVILTDNYNVPDDINSLLLSFCFYE